MDNYAVIGGVRYPLTKVLKKVIDLMDEHATLCEETGKQLKYLVSTKKLVAKYAHLRKHKIHDLADFLGISTAALYVWMRDLENGNYSKPELMCSIQRR